MYSPSLWGCGQSMRYTMAKYPSVPVKVPVMLDPTVALPVRVTLGSGVADALAPGVMSVAASAMRAQRAATIRRRTVVFMGVDSLSAVGDHNGAGGMWLCAAANRVRRPTERRWPGRRGPATRVGRNAPARRVTAVGSSAVGVA